MATSGSTNFNRTATQIIKTALRKLGVIGEGETPSAEQTQNALEGLNLMVKQWQAKGYNLWCKTEANLFLESGQASYELGLSGTDRAADVSDSAITTLASACSSGASTAVVSSATGIAVDDIFGINISSTTTHWSTVTSVSGTSISFADAITADAASGNSVYAYTNLMPRPNEVTSARLAYYNGNETPLHIANRDEYFNQANKTSSGKVTMVYYDPQLTTGKMYVWNVNDDIRDIIKFTYIRPIQDFDSLNDDPDYPQEWLSALSWNLAVELAPEYGKTEDKMRLIMMKADQTLNDALGRDTDVSLYISPAINYRMR